MKRLIFLDRDGVINRNISEGYVLKIEQFDWLPGALDGLRLLNNGENKICVVTNQAAVHKGLLAEQALQQIHDHMLATVRVNQGNIDKVHYCPHTKEERCSCRKPGAGMLLREINQHEKDGLSLWMVGDSLDDMRAGKTAGCATILVESPRTIQELDRTPGEIYLADYYVKNLFDAAQIIQDLRR